MDSGMTQLKTRDIEALVCQVNALHSRWRGYTLEYDPDETVAAQAWRDEMIKCLHRLMRPAGRPYAIPTLLGMIERMFYEWGLYLELLEDAQAWSRQKEEGALYVKYERATHEVQALRARVATLEQQLAREQADSAAWRERALSAAPATVEIPAQTVTVRSKLDREVLHLIAVTGLARSWHIITRVMETGVAQHENGVRNAIKRLKEAELLTDFTWNGKAQQWKPRAGGGRQLLQLTKLGQTWAEAAFKITAAPCELDRLVQKHKGVEHAVGILEAQHWLAAAGFTVDLEPPARPYNAADPWGARVEPDLTATLRGELWPVEVQREVDTRNGEKWRKAVELYGRLMLIVFNEQRREKQLQLLREELARWDWPTGSIWVWSLEALERGVEGWTMLKK